VNLLFKTTIGGSAPTALSMVPSTILAPAALALSQSHP
jgi:hypothetical protein